MLSYSVASFLRVLHVLQSFVHLIENQFNTTLKTIRTDNGPEFFMTEFFNTKGIYPSNNLCRNTSINVIVERKYQYILNNIARPLLFQSHLPKILWSYVVLHSVFLINRLPTPLLKDKSPFEILYQSQPDYTYHKVFGCLSFASTLAANRHKFDSRARRCIFLGYKSEVKGFILMDLHSREIFLSRNVWFYENCF